MHASFGPIRAGEGALLAPGALNVCYVQPNALQPIPLLLAFVKHELTFKSLPI